MEIAWSLTLFVEELKIRTWSGIFVGRFIAAHEYFSRKDPNRSMHI
jgi:hypothetical protein